MKTVPDGDGFLFAAGAAARSPFMTWPSKSATALWENAPPGHFLIPQGELRTADVYRPALPVVLGLRCECQLYGTTASQVPVLCSMGAQCGSTTGFCGADLRAQAGVSPSTSENFFTLCLHSRSQTVLHYYNERGGTAGAGKEKPCAVPSFG